MKKLSLIILSFITIFTLLSCQKKESIDNPKEFQPGDIVEFNGVIYEYMDIWDDITGKATLEYVFEEEENYLSFYDVYYLDMSEYKNQPKLREDKNIFNLTTFDNSLRHNPIQKYAMRVSGSINPLDYTSYLYDDVFVVKGYTEQLPKNVIIPPKIHGKYVTQIGFKAFQHAPMESICIKGYYTIVHPFAINQCDYLKELVCNNSLILSMGISDCKNIEKISGISPTMDCSLYRLEKLKEIHDLDIYINNNQPLYGCYGMGGYRKSFFYQCPMLESLIGENIYNETSISEAFNTVYYNFSYGISIPLYVKNHYTAIIDDVVYIHNDSQDMEWFSIMYNPDTLEAYVPFLNDGLEKEGRFIFKNSSGLDSVIEDETGIFIRAMYRNPIFNATLLFQKK